jgi:hypothetical protein
MSGAVEKMVYWLVGGLVLQVANVFGRRDAASKIVRHLLGGLKRKNIVVEAVAPDALVFWIK